MPQELNDKSIRSVNLISVLKNKSLPKKIGRLSKLNYQRLLKSDLFFSHHFAQVN